MPDGVERRVKRTNPTEHLIGLEIALAKGFAESKADHQSTKKDLSNLNKQLEDLNHSIYGNGKDGLITVVSKLKMQLRYLISILGVIGITYLTTTLDLVKAIILR